MPAGLFRNLGLTLHSLCTVSLEISAQAQISHSYKQNMPKGTRVELTDPLCLKGVELGIWVTGLSQVTMTKATSSCKSPWQTKLMSCLS